jgi:hypothetical protein
VAVVLAVTLASSAVAVSAPTDTSTLEVDEYVQLFAADGGRVAYPTGVPRRGDECEGATVWDTSGGEAMVLPLARSTYLCADEWAGTETVEIAIAGDRVAWLAHGATLSSSQLDLYTARLGSRRARLVMSGDGPTFSGDDVESDNRELGLLDGDGSDIVFAAWTVARGGKKIRDERLWRIDARGKGVSLGSVRGMRSLAVDDGIAAILTAGGKVTLVPVAGGQRRTLTLPGLATRMLGRRGWDLRLNDGRLVVLTSSTVDVYDADSGTPVASWSIGPARGQTRGILDVEGDYASFLTSNRIHLLRLSNGAEAVVPPERVHPPGCEESPVWAQLEPVGLIFAQTWLDVEGCQQSRIDTISFEELAALLPATG